ncbi:hypothetical protein B7P43_G11812 [Cryptotermes secundus]|uniref:Mos1 transposase HTH domain-containing protein n=1 Tax=Cryptotermes secundus TaxID=105785 RepID=A0A2J7RBP4_9NEOP|nr:hypothetical protein B7P43_G11812 [Cryptotermes secundus]
MAALLVVCTKEEQRTVIQFLWWKVSGAEIHQSLSTQYRNSALPHRSVYEWIEKFKSGRTSVTHEEGAVRPSTSTSDEMIQQAREMVLVNRRVTVNEVACSLQISHGSAYEIIHDELGFHNTIETINHLGFHVLEHPAYSPDLAPSDYNLFGLLKDALRGCRFSTDKVVWGAVHKWLCDHTENLVLGRNTQACGPLDQSVSKRKETM